MKGNISGHSALTAYQRKTAVNPVAVPQTTASRDGSTSSTSVRAARVSASDEARAPAAVEPPTDRAKVKRAKVERAKVDRAKVERLRTALEAGDLTFDADLVAQRIIDQGE